mgnify:CR=1 FL=1
MPLPDSTIVVLAAAVAAWGNPRLTLAERVVGITIVVEYFRREGAGLSSHRLRRFTLSGKHGVGEQAGVNPRTVSRAIKELAGRGVLESHTMRVSTSSGMRRRLYLRPVATDLPAALAALAGA